MTDNASTPVNTETTSSEAMKPDISADELLEIYESEETTESTPSEEEKANINTKGKETEQQPQNDKDSIVKSEQKPTLENAIKIKSGEEELSIPESGEISAVLNGKDVTFQVKDAIKAYLSQDDFNRNMDRRMTAIVQKEQKFESSKTTTISNLQRIVEAAQVGDLNLALRTMAELVKRDPVEYEKEIMPKLQQDIMSYANMTEQERALYHANRKLELVNRQLSQKEQAEKNEQERTAFKAKVDELKNQHSLNDKQFFDYFQEMVESGLKPANEITPEDVVKYHTTRSHVDKVHQAISSIDKNMAMQESFFDDIYHATKDSPELTVEDISEIVKDILGSSKSVESLNAKVADAAKVVGVGAAATNANQSKKVSSKDKKINDYDDEDLNFLYRRR